MKAFQTIGVSSYYLRKNIYCVRLPTVDWCLDWFGLIWFGLVWFEGYKLLSNYTGFHSNNTLICGQSRFWAEFGFMYAMKVIWCDALPIRPNFAVAHVVILVDVKDSCLCHQQIAVRCVIGW